MSFILLFIKSNSFFEITSKERTVPKIAVIGSNSFSGSHFISHFLENTNYEIVGISRSPEYSYLFLPYRNISEEDSDQCSVRFKFFQFDMNKQLSEIIRLLDNVKPEIIVNFAAQGNVANSWNEPEHWLRTNTLALANLTFHLRDKDYLKKFVQISTPEIYGFCNNLKEDLGYYNPSTPYAVSKVAGDLFLSAMFKKYKFPVCFVRSTNFYGPHQQLYRIVPKTIIYLKSGKKLPLHGGGKVSRDFIHIYDVVDGIGKVVQNGKIGQAYHLSSGKLVKIRRLVKIICERMGFGFKKSIEFSNERIDQDSSFGIDSSKMREELKWQPKICLAEGIDTVVDWVESNWHEILDQPLEYIHKE